MSTINLLPDDYAKKQAQFRASVLCVVLFAIIMAGVWWASRVSDEKHDSLREDQLAVNEQYKRTEQVIATMHDLEQRKTLMEKRAKDTSDLMEKLPRSFLMAKASLCCPETIRLRQMEIFLNEKTKKNRAGRIIRTKGNAEYYTEMVLTGFVKGGTDRDLARYLDALESMEFVDRADLVRSDEILRDQMVVREFEVKLFVKMGIDAIEHVGPSEVARVDEPLPSSRSVSGWISRLSGSADKE
jgi:hypothetical protein